MFGLAFAFRNSLYQAVVSYKPSGERPYFKVEDRELICFIEENIHKSQYDVKELVDLSLSITAKCLRFNASSVSNEPNACFTSHSADCMGYATLQSSVCNYLFQKFGMGEEWIAQPMVGEIYFLGVDVHPYLKGPFFRNHDFVKVENLVTKERFYTDPSFYDYIHIDYISVKR